MTERSNKKRFSALIHDSTYNKVDEFVKNNELITGRLVPGTILELGILLFFKEIQKRPLEDIAIEYFTDGKPGDATNE